MSCALRIVFFLFFKKKYNFTEGIYNLRQDLSTNTQVTVTPEAIVDMYVLISY